MVNTPILIPASRLRVAHHGTFIKFALPILLAAAVLTAAAQQSPTISTRTNLVSLIATVHDPDGRVVKNLTPDDFLLLEDGKPQQIIYFSQESDLPLTIGLLVDTSRSQTGVLEQERRASYTFLDQVLREGTDHAFIAHFDIRVGILQDPTSSRDALQMALERLKIPDRDSTLVFSAIKECSEDPMYHLRGRKAFILLSDGVAHKESTSITEAIEYAQRADTIIYPIRFADPENFSRPVIGAILAIASQHGKQGLHRMANETGGAYFEVTPNESIEDIYAQIEEDLRNQYSVGYTPGRAKPDGKYHKIKLTTKDRHFTVNTRAGYYAK
ncbi:MAG: VWA domain-containing protein [Candidatus Acidiferrales bacterium]